MERATDERFSVISATIITLSRLRALGGIDHHSIVANDGAGCQARLIGMRFPENVHHLLTCGQKVVGDDPAVAPPPDRFCAHDYAPLIRAAFP